MLLLSCTALPHYPAIPDLIADLSITASSTRGPGLTYSAFRVLAFEAVEAETLPRWIACFYRLLLQGGPFDMVIRSASTTLLMFCCRMKFLYSL